MKLYRYLLAALFCALSSGAFAQCSGIFPAAGAVCGHPTSGSGGIARSLTTLPTGVQDNITRLGTLTPGPVSLLSGGAATQTYYGLGRTAEEGLLGVAGATNGLLTGTAAGDIALRGNANLWLGTTQSGTPRPHIGLTSAGATRFYASGTLSGQVAANGQFLIGGTAASTITDPLLVVSRNATALPDTTNGASEIWVAHYGLADGTRGGMGIDTFGTGVTTAFGVFDFRRARGTAASPLVLQSGDLIGVTGFLGYVGGGGTGYSGGAAQMRGYAADPAGSTAWSPTSQPSGLMFLTTPVGGTAFAGVRSVLWLDPTGFVGINPTGLYGPTVAPSALLTASANTASLPTAPAGAGTIARIANADANPTTLLLDAFGTGQFTAVSGRLARGTAALPTAVQSGDFLAILSGLGYGATAYSIGAGRIQITAAQNFTDAAQGSRVSIWTTPNGSAASAIAEVARFDQDKSVSLFGALSVTGAINAFTLGGTISGGGNQINNVIIGTSTPLAGAFTTLSASTSMSCSMGGANCLTVSGSSTNSIGLKIDNSSPTSSWVVGISGSAGPGGTGEFFWYQDSGGGAALAFGLASGTGAARFLSTVAATSATTGSLKTAGGLGVAGAGWFGTYVATGVVAVGALPACGAGIKGARMFVTDSNAASYTAGIGAIVAAGGATNVPVVCDGTNWRIGSLKPANDNLGMRNVA